MVENKYLSSASTYHDMSGLQKLRTGAKNNDDQALVAVAKQLEGVFLNMMLKSMRQANSVFAEGNPMNSKETEFYQGMYDQQISLTMSEGKGIGLADVIVRQMRGMHTDREKIDELIKKNSSPKDDSSQGLPLLSSNVALPLPLGPDPMALLQRNENYPLPLERFRSLAVAKFPVEGKMINTELSPTTSVSEIPESKRNHPAMVSEPSNNLLDKVESSLRNLFPTASAFVDAITPYAKAAANELGVDVNAIIAQAVLETGWGSHLIDGKDGKPSFNFFGIKSGANWHGDSSTVKTMEYRDGVIGKETAAFRSYKSMDAAFQDYISFLKDNPRYHQALNNTTTAKEWGFQLQQAGYATDPNYGKKIASIVSRLDKSDRN